MAASSKHHVRNRILGGLGAVILVVVGFFMWQKTKVQLYDDPNTTGNTAGNLLNGGKFCEADGRIYYADPYDNDSLYVTDDKLQKSTKLHGDTVSYLNVAGDYIFYTRRNDRKSVTGGNVLALSKTGLFRVTTDGKNMGKLYDEPTQSVCLYGNYLYYQHYDEKKGLQLNAAKMDGSSDELLLDEGVSPYSISQGVMYYTGYDKDHNIHTMNINGSDEQTIYNGNCTSLIRAGEHLYFLDMSQNYALVRVNLDGSNPVAIVSDRLATYNVDEKESAVYYQVDNGTSNGLYVKDLEGGEVRKIADGNYNYLHLTSKYLFYETYDGKSVYVMDLGTEQEKPFQAPVGKKTSN